jgi:glutamate/aspartate transport system permease protein
MNYWQSMGQVVLPQAFRNMLPVMLTQAVILFQDTSLVYVVGLKDFLGAASKGGQITGRIVELYLFVAVVFFLICFLASWGVKKLNARLAVAR